ncbi:MAG: alpha/beta hydrolase family protein [Opitutaceae bacterium]
MEPTLTPESIPSRAVAGRGSSLTRRQALGVLGGLALPWPELLAQTRSTSAAPAAVPGPGATSAASTVPPARADLPNFEGLMEWLARDNSPRLSFLDEKWRSLEAWKQAARPVFRHALSYQPTAKPLAADVIGREERRDFTVERVNIHATEAYHIPARVLIPKRREGRLPAVVAMHCHSGRYVWGHEKVLSHPDDSAALTEFRNAAYGRPWAEVLAQRGYVVIVTDAFYFGERRLRIEDMPPQRVASEAELLTAINRVCSSYEHLTAKTLFTTGITWPGLHVWDDMRTVDYLATRPEVDPERIGCAGLSIGGLRTAHLIAADARIKAASITGWMTRFAYQLRNHLRNHTWMIYIPGLYRSLDFPDAAALHAPGALLVQQCSRDQLYPLEAMKGAVDQLTRIYAKAGIPERFRGTFHDEPHSFKPHMQDETFDWLDRWL